MKKWALSVVTAAAVALAAFGLADAQEQGRRHGPGFGGPGGRGGGMRFGRIADLTDQQREQIRTILAAEREGRQGPPPVAQLHRQLDTELLADAPDEQKIETLKQQIAQATAEGLTRQVAIQRKIAQVLTPEQRAKARETLSQPRRGERREKLRF
jgi:Spy/CpxP family protein refolding chaperone